jgi:ribosome biogenesis GTPase A
MEITAALMKHILNKTSDADEIAEEINDYKKVYNKILENKRIKEEKRKEFEEFIHNLDSCRKSIQSGCDHPTFEYSGDPSGGNDSFHRCDICGKEW